MDIKKHKSAAHFPPKEIDTGKDCLTRCPPLALGEVRQAEKNVLQFILKIWRLKKKFNHALNQALWNAATAVSYWANSEQREPKLELWFLLFFSDGSVN